MDFLKTIGYNTEKQPNLWERKLAGGVLVAYHGYLMSGDREIARIENDKIIPMKMEQMPLLLMRGGSLEDWLKSRAIDRHRPNSRILKKILRLNDAGDIAAVLRSHAATITDNYWLKSEQEPALSYAHVRFTENQFADVALSGSFESFGKGFTKEQLSTRTPELTSIGSFEKCWRLEDGAWWMYKQGSAEERFSELFIAALGHTLGFHMAEYLPDGAYIKTKDFTESRWNFEPAAALVGDKEDYGYNYERIVGTAPLLIPQYLNILFMDALCFNMDRHTYNYGFLRDQETGRIVSMAPNFDNNIALISRGYASDPFGTSELLIRLFLELLEEKKLAYIPPAIEKDMLRDLAATILPEERINREYVVSMVEDRYSRLEQGLQNLTQGLSPSPSM